MPSKGRKLANFCYAYFAGVVGSLVCYSYSSRQQEKWRMTKWRDFPLRVNRMAFCRRYERFLVPTRRGTTIKFPSKVKTSATTFIVP